MVCDRDSKLTSLRENNLRDTAGNKLGSTVGRVVLTDQWSNHQVHMRVCFVCVCLRVHVQ